MLNMKLAMSVRRMSSWKHLTQAEMTLWIQNLEANGRKPLTPPKPVPNASLKPITLHPHEYHAPSSKWISLSHGPKRSFDRGDLIKVVSWNIDWSGPGPDVRASAILEHLESRFGNGCSRLVVMFQEVCLQSLRTILDNPWVQRTFALSNVQPPDSVCAETLGKSFVMKTTEWEAAPYFNLMMISKDLPIADCFQVPFQTSMGRYALAVDIPVIRKDASETTESIRLCTTHLESLWRGRYYRPHQLATISTILKHEITTNYKVVAGLVGGDMNAIELLDHSLHAMNAIQLKDAWDDVPALPSPVLKPFQKDLSYGQAKGNTWGYQSKSSRQRKRLDKFFYTGPIETVAVEEAQDVAGRLGRLGIGLKVEVEAWMQEESVGCLVRGRYVNKIRKTFLADHIVARIREKGKYTEGNLARTMMNTWASDHFGITLGIRLLANGIK